MSESFGEHIRRLRIEQKLSLRLVAAHIDLDQSTLSKVERNEKQAPKFIVKPLAELLKQPYEALQIRFLSEKIYLDLKHEDGAIEATELALDRLKQGHTGSKTNKKREALVDKLQQYLAKAPVQKAWLFGSFARDEERYDSDIDLLVQFDKTQAMDVFDYIGITYELEDLLGRNVDLVEEGNLSEDAALNANNEKKLIYER